jgi:hypothetical protein
MRRIVEASSVIVAMLLLARPVTAQPAIPTVNFASAAPTAAAVPQPSQDQRFYVGVHAGFGSGSLLDVIDENCGSFDGAFGLECTGDDRGAVWAVGVDARWGVNRFLDLGLRAEYTKPADITLDASGIFEGIPLASMLRGEGSLSNFSGQVGLSASERFRIYSGYGASRFDFDVTATFTAFNQTETQTDNASGWGHHFYAGAEYFLRPRLSLFGEGGRSWLKDDSSNLQEEDFEETYSRWIVGARFELARPRWR